MFAPVWDFRHFPLDGTHKPAYDDVMSPAKISKSPTFVVGEMEHHSQAAKPRIIDVGGRQVKLATRDDWDALAARAMAEHEAYMRWRRDGQPGNAPATPARPTYELLHDVMRAGVTRRSLPAGRPPKGATRPPRLGPVPSGKTVLGRDRLADDALVAWIRQADPHGNRSAHGLHNELHEAGIGCNTIRFKHLIQIARGQ